MYHSAIYLLAALYHESGRPSVAAGNTLAHTVGQARPFTEFADLDVEARMGRVLTARAGGMKSLDGGGCTFHVVVLEVQPDVAQRLAAHLYGEVTLSIVAEPEVPRG